ncbi:MAG: ATP/GTP-binding protein [Nitrosomonadales bacterium]|nr:ATP/GTP-binding protein [Nitrosomonadales bacterium]
MENKIIFAGPVGSGKTTSISSVSDIMVVGTEAKASDEVAQRKSNTTVAMDYGILNLDGGMKVHLYGTPGQDRFNFMWEILSEGAMGIVILIDHARPDPLGDMETYLKAFGQSIAKCGNAVVIGVTRTELDPQPDLLDRFHQRLATLNLNIPVFEVDGRQREDVKQLLLALLSLIDPTTSRTKAA